MTETCIMGHMSDAHLRELERRWRKTGSVQDEATYLKERVRLGELTPERLELAAYCGHEAAGGIAVPTDLTKWLEGLEKHGAAPLTVVAAETAARVLPHWERGLPSTGGVRAEGPREVVATLSALIASPESTKHVLLERLRQALAVMDEGTELVHDDSLPAWDAWDCIWAAGNVPLAKDPSRQVVLTAKAARRFLSEPALGEAIRSRLIAWGLTAEPRQHE